MATLSLEEWLERAESDRRFRENATSITHILHPRAALPRILPGPPRLKTVLEKRGLKRLYSHQAQAVELVRQGGTWCSSRPRPAARPCATTCPCSSASSRARDACPVPLSTKALANDQMHEVHGLIGELKADIKTFTYDGDTPDDARQAIRRQGHVVVTTLTCSTRASCRTTPSGRSSSPTSRTWWWTSCTSTAGCSAAT